MTRDPLHGVTARNFLAIGDYPAFRLFLLGEGYVEEDIPPTSKWEVGRFRLFDYAGTNPPLIVYRRLKGAHLTVHTHEGQVLVRAFLDHKHGRTPQ